MVDTARVAAALALKYASPPATRLPLTAEQDGCMNRPVVKNCTFGLIAVLLWTVTSVVPTRAQSFDDPTPSKAEEIAPWAQTVTPTVRPQSEKRDLAFPNGGYGREYQTHSSDSESIPTKPEFNTDDYLTGVGAGRQPVRQIAPGAATQDRSAAGDQPLDYRSPFNKGYFEGKVGPDTDVRKLVKGIQLGPFKTAQDPAWAHVLQKMHYFEDGQEHYGNGDGYGFFDK